MWSENPPRNALPGGGNLEREEQALYPLPESWRHVHWTPDTGGPRTMPASELEAREIRTFQMIDR
jgi:hypothetical protein